MTSLSWLPHLINVSKNQTYLTRLRELRDITCRETYMLSTWYMLSKLDSGGGGDGHGCRGSRGGG